VASNLAELSEAVADAVPDRVALIDGTERVSYRELERLANQLAHHLAARGVGCDDAVGVMARNSVPFVVAFLACLKLRFDALGSTETSHNDPEQTGQTFVTHQAARTHCPATWHEPRKTARSLRGQQVLRHRGVPRRIRASSAGAAGPRPAPARRLQDSQGLLLRAGHRAPDLRQGRPSLDSTDIAKEALPART
jgi:acyl-CoA synthetase (AMP-forming)/AMP-acid ligase II